MGALVEEYKTTLKNVVFCVFLKDLSVAKNPFLSYLDTKGNYCRRG